MNYKIAGQSVSAETQKTLEKLNSTPDSFSDAHALLKDGKIESADEANTLLNVVSDEVIDDADYDKINRGLRVDNHIYHDEFSNLAKVFEKKFPRNGQSGFKGLTRFGVNPFSPVRIDSSHSPLHNLERYGITTELYKSDAGKERVLVKHGEKEIFHIETDTHFEVLNVEVFDSDLLYLAFTETGLEPEAHPATLQFDDVDFEPELPEIPHEVSEMGFEFSNNEKKRIAVCQTPLFNNEGERMSWDPTVPGQNRKRPWALFDAVKYSEEPNGNQIIKFVSNEGLTATITIKPDGRTSVKEVLDEGLGSERLIAEYELQYKPPVKAETVTPAEKVTSGAKSQVDGQSTSSVPHTVADVLTALETVLGPGRDWKISGEIGQKFIEALPSLTKELPALDDWLNSKAALGPKGVALINQFLEKNGYADAKLDASGIAEGDVVAASILDLKFSWENPAEATKMTLVSGNEVDAVKMKGVNIYQSELHANPIARIPTKEEGVFVCLTRYDGSFSADDPLAVYDYAGKLAKDVQQERAGRKGPIETIFPMVDYNKSGDMDWLKGASTLDANGNPVTISQAKYQHKFKLDPNGVEAGGAAAVGTTRGMAPKPIMIDGPFVAWVEVDGVVAFAGYMDESVMKDPR